MSSRLGFIMFSVALTMRDGWLNAKSYRTWPPLFSLSLQLKLSFLPFITLFVYRGSGCFFLAVNNVSEHNYAATTNEKSVDSIADLASIITCHLTALSSVGVCPI